RDVGRGHVRNVAPARVDLGGLVRVDVQPGDLEPRTGEFDGQRQADIPEPDDADPRASRANTIEKRTDHRVSHALTKTTPEGYRAGDRSARRGRPDTRSRSAETTMATSAAKSTVGFHPSSACAFELSPMRCSTSAGRM